MRSKTKKKILITFAFLFLVLTALVYTHASFIIIFDRAISDIVTHAHTVFLDQTMMLITRIGDIVGAVTIFAFLAIILIAKRKKYSLYILATTAIISPLSIVFIKGFVGRSRPHIPNPLISAVGPSFPSGHATISTIFLLSALILIAPIIKNKFLHKIFLTISIILFPLIALSRIYLSVHFASDVLGGVLLGIICFIGADIFVKKYLKR